MFLIILLWEGPRFSLSSPKLLNFLSKKVVLFIYYVFLKIVERFFTICHFGEGECQEAVVNVEELASKQSPMQFSRTCREGNKIFIIQWGSNAHGNFLLISELIHGRYRGSIVIPEGNLGRGWGGFGLHLRETLEDSLLR